MTNPYLDELKDQFRSDQGGDISAADWDDFYSAITYIENRVQALRDVHMADRDDITDIVLEETKNDIVGGIRSLGRFIDEEF